MKKIIIFLNLVIVVSAIFAQTPQSFQYQTVVRDVGGNVITSQNIGFRISIISGSPTGTVEYVETHSQLSNAYGIVTLNIGNGTPVSGVFSSITWGSLVHFIKVETDPSGGTSYLDMGTTQLLSVPYALYSENAGNIPTYNGGTGIDVTGTTITNTLPDQTVNLIGTGSTTVMGTYPNFTINSTDNNTMYTAGTGIDVTGTTITNTAPDQSVSISGTGATTVSGTYPNFIINSTDNNTIYSAGTGLNLTGTTFSNTSPDQTVTLTQGGATTITGTYPNFTISSTDNNTTYTAGSGLNLTGNTFSNTAPDQTVTLTQGGATTISGTYPNFTISSTDLNTGTPGGLNKTVQFNNSGSFGGDTALIWDNTNKRLGVGLSNPTGRVVIKGSATAPASEPLFEIKNAQGQQIMAVYNDSIHFFITDIGANQGGFAVSGRNNAKALTNDFLRINADSTRIWTSDTVQGFGVRNIGVSSKTSYMQLTPSNYFIGHESGINNTSGLYNCFLGYQAGKANTSGRSNIFIGYQSGIVNSTGNDNVSIGNQSLYNNTTGYSNTANGYQALHANTLGYQNNAFGYKALYSNIGTNIDGYNNNAFGYMAMYANTYGHDNNAFGSSALYNNTTGTQNVAIGYNTMYSNTTGWANVALGNITMYYNTTGPSNTALGDQCMYNNTTGGSNVAVGRWALYYNNGSSNTAVGAIAYFSATPTAYTNSTALGNSAVISASNQVRVGSNAVTSIGGQVGWTTLSDKRFKKNISEDVHGLDFITKLHPVTYNVDIEIMDDYLQIPDSIRKKHTYKEKFAYKQCGFLAQDVETVANEIGFDFSGIDKPKNENDYYGLRYSEFTVPLVKAVQELNSENINLKKTIEDQSLKINELQKQINELRSFIKK